MPAAERALSMRAELPPELFTAVLWKGLLTQDMQPYKRHGMLNSIPRHTEA